MSKKASSEIVNFYEHIPKKYLDESDNPNHKHHNISLPFRMCVVAPSGSGKTNFLLNLIKVFSMGEGTFADISIITQNKDEPLYNYLEGEFEQIKIKDYKIKMSLLTIIIFAILLLSGSCNSCINKHCKTE
jgi:septin family protein